MGSYGDLWRARVRLLRPGNAVMAAVAVVLGVRLAGPWPDLGTTIGAALAAFLVTAFGNVLNDVLDAGIDRTAHPHRPIPSGLVTRQEARRFAGLLLILGLFEAWLAAGSPLLAFALVNAAVLAWYELRLKRLPLVGNAVVGLLVASTLAFGGVANGAAPGPVVWLMMAMMALTNLAREVLKDIEDMHADAGRRTWPMLVGPGAASWTATVALGIAVGLAAVVALEAPRWSGLLLWASALSFVVASGLGCWQAARGQRALKLVMLLALVAFGAYALGF